MERTRFVLIRHGQTVWNQENRFRGQLNPELDELGLRQADATGKYVARRWPVVAVYSSPLSRALQTASAVAHEQGLDVESFSGLMDVNFGYLHGKTWDEAAARWPEVTRAWIEAPHTVHFPGGESLDNVRQRAWSGLCELSERHTGQCVALVSHTVVNKVLLCAVLGLGNEHFWRVHQDTCAVNVFESVQGVYVVTLLNDTSHLLDVL
ncbi:MAG: histidine phosphatase family protein [Anaerolineales bacterium]|nr:histidine phosphatase family protein [Anaerolineales bacterium]